MGAGYYNNSILQEQRQTPYTCTGILKKMGSLQTFSATSSDLSSAVSIPQSPRPMLSSKNPMVEIPRMEYAQPSATNVREASIHSIARTSFFRTHR